MGEKVAVGGRCVGFVEQFEGLLLRDAAYTLVRKGVVGGVKDAVTGRCGWEEYPSRHELLEIANIYVVDVSCWLARGERKYWVRLNCSRMSRTSSRGMRFFTQR